MAPDFDTLLERLEELLTLLAQNGVKLNISKCSFALKEVTYLGHSVTSVIFPKQAPVTVGELQSVFI